MRSKYISTLGKPKIYAYTTPEYSKRKWSGTREGVGLLKIGYTERDVEARMREHFPTKGPDKNPYKIMLVDDALTKDGKFFTDHAIHRILQESGFTRVGGEWFECTVSDVERAILQQKLGKPLEGSRTNDFAMRPEQIEAVRITKDYFEGEIARGSKSPHFLWNAKMRFGKTFSAYQLARSMKWKRVMVLTYKPAVEREWRAELASHVDFQGWQFFGRGDDFSKIDGRKPLIWFASFQDILGKSPSGGIKQRYEAARVIDWDCIMLDEYHFGSWREAAKELYDADSSEGHIEEEFSEEKFPLSANSFLYLTGTPFRALANGEFLEDQIFTWSYIDEQRAKLEWNKPEPNPYSELPQMVLMTYQLPDEVRNVALRGEMNEFDLNEFFKAEEVKDKNGKATGKHKFIHKSEVQMWLSLIRGQYLQAGFKPDSGGTKPPLPYADAELLAYLNHSFWFLPNVASCYAMAEILREPVNSFFSDYNIVVAAGPQAGMGTEALPPVLNAIGRGQDTKSITLSCAKLTTGVSVPQWCGMFMLKNTSSPETYFQTAFRVQTPWTVRNSDKTDPKTQEILKEKCYIFDFAPNRALKLITEYSSRLDLRDTSQVEEKIKDFLNFLPVLAYDGFSMTPLDARELLDIAASGVGATMLARRWQSAQLVRVDNDTIERLLNNPDIIAALEGIEAFRNLGKDLTKVINSEKALAKLEREKTPKSPDDKREEKENKNFKKELREKLLKFVSRVPVFMYLTDYREETLKDVIMQLERPLFTKVTGLQIKDFEKMCEIGVFNSQAMNSAIFSFRRFELGSLHYAGGGTELETIGLFDTTVSAIEGL
jgi:hypothetical protein